jgi:long-chain fatty acid transport protein
MNDGRSTVSRGRMKPALIGLGSLVLLAIAAPARAENGAKLMGLGAASRSMGGVGTAFPQEAIGAMSANPATLGYRPRADEWEFGLGGTVILTRVEGEVDVADGRHIKAGDDGFVPLSSMALAAPVTTGDDFPRVFGGFSILAYGGLGADFRSSDLDQPAFFDLGGGARSPLVASVFTQLGAFAFAPTLAVEPVDGLAIGVQPNLTATILDLRQGSSTAYSFGVQAGLAVRPNDFVHLGLSCQTAQRSRFKNVIDLGNGRASDLTNELPEAASAGVAIEPVADVLLFEVDLKWIGWASAEGFKQADWRDQWVVAFGAQFTPRPGLDLRIGYNFGENPVKLHQNFVGTDLVPGPAGAPIPRYYAETSRLIAMNATAEHHFTLGVGYAVSSRVTAELGLVSVPSNKVVERGTDPTGKPAAIKAKGDFEETIELGLAVRF